MTVRVSVASDIDIEIPLVSLIAELQDLLTKVPEEYRGTAELEGDYRFELYYYRKETEEELKVNSINSSKSQRIARIHELQRELQVTLEMEEANP